MSDVLTSINYDEKDPIFNQIKDEFTEELSKRFSSENYEEITKYVFVEVFKKQHTKQNCIKELSSIFKDKTEDIINFLWNLVDKKLKEKDQDNSAKGDVLVNILKDDHKKNSPSKNDSRERSHDYKYDNKRNDRRKGSRDYQRGNNRDKYYNNRRGGYNNKYSSERMKIGDKEVILHPGSNRRRERSRSRDEDNEQYDDEYNYPPQRGGHFQRGMYPPMPMMYGKYYQQYPMMGYMEPRR